MTDPKKPRWTAEQRRGGVERRAELRGSRESRLFRIATTSGPAMARAANGTSSAITLAGTAIVYGVPYGVSDAFGTFIESVSPGAVSDLLATADVRLLFDHSGLVLARTTSGTLTLRDTPNALTCSATLEPRQQTAVDLALAISRGDVNQMSISFVVGEDEWSSDYSRRVITTFVELLDVSAVAFPASPTTSIEILDLPGALAPAMGDDGTEEIPAVVGPDGTRGRRRAVELEAELELLELRGRRR
jgi:uncharacterized protein